MLPKPLSSSEILEFSGQCWDLKTKQEVSQCPCTKQKDIGFEALVSVLAIEIQETLGKTGEIPEKDH